MISLPTIKKPIVQIGGFILVFIMFCSFVYAVGKRVAVLANFSEDANIIVEKIKVIENGKVIDDLLLNNEVTVEVVSGQVKVLYDNGNNLIFYPGKYIIFEDSIFSSGGEIIVEKLVTKFVIKTDKTTVDVKDGDKINIKEDTIEKNGEVIEIKKGVPEIEELEGEPERIEPVSPHKP